MYNYQYTLDVSSWSTKAQKYITDIVKTYNIVYNIQRSSWDPQIVILNLKGHKDELDKLELKLIKNLSTHADIEDFTKTTTKLSEDITKDNTLFDIETCEFSLFYKSKKQDNPLDETIKLLKSQKIGLIKNINGYYLCAISSKSAPVKKIRKILDLPTQTLPLLVKTTLQASKFIVLSKKEETLLNSEIKPFIKTRKKNIHRLEKIKNIPINSVAPTNSYKVKLPKNSLENFLANEVNIPLIFYKIKDIDIVMDSIDFILSFEKNFLDYEDSFMQVVYGKNQIITLGFGLDCASFELDKKLNHNICCIDHDNVSIAYKNILKLSPCCINKDEFFIINHFQPDTIVDMISKNSISLAHVYDSQYEKALVFEFTSEKGKIFIYENHTLEEKYHFQKPIKEYFDEVLIKYGILKTINYTNESQLICDNSYEICFEKSYEYSIIDKNININLSKELQKNEVSSALLNSFTNIVKDIYELHKLPVVLCGDVFENKNLTENIIEFFDDHDIKYHISTKIPLNKTSSSLGTLLDNIQKR